MISSLMFIVLVIGLLFVFFLIRLVMALLTPFAQLKAKHEEKKQMKAEKKHTRKFDKTMAEDADYVEITDNN